MPADRPTLVDLPARAARGLIWVYQRTLSPALVVLDPTGGCRFAPTCSHYACGALAEHGLIQGNRIGVDASTMEANAALRSIVRRDSGEGYREMLKRLAAESGIETPTTEDLIRLDRRRKGKRLSNADWASPTDSDAKIAKMKDGRTRLAYKPEHAVDLDSGAIVAAEIHPADQGDTTTLPGTLQAAEANLTAAEAAPASAASRRGSRGGWRGGAPRYRGAGTDRWFPTSSIGAHSGSASAMILPGTW